MIVSAGGLGTSGFFAQGEGEPTAICLLPGTEIAFDTEPQYYVLGAGSVQGKHKTAVFRQVDKHIHHVHHDALEFADGAVVLLTRLQTGQTATVLQLPAEPRNDEEAKEQERVIVVESRWEPRPIEQLDQVF
jgi:hypothetical protein